MKPGIIKNFATKKPAQEEEKTPAEPKMPRQVSSKKQGKSQPVHKKHTYVSEKVNLCRDKVGVFRSLFTRYRQSEMDKYREV